MRPTIQSVDRRVDVLDVRLERVETKLDEHTRILDEHTEKLEALDKKIDGVESRVVRELKAYMDLKTETVLSEFRVLRDELQSQKVHVKTLEDGRIKRLEHQAEVHEARLVRLERKRGKP